MPSSERATSDPMLGRRVEGYRITNLVGKGGMGAVYEAVHEAIGQRAAIKVLFPEFSTDVDAVSRFVAEARAASKVRHGGLVKIFYSGRLDDGTAYIMMEFLEGESIEERLCRLGREGKRMELPAVTRIGAQIASALTAVHREGIVHRDLKPANLILVADPEIDGGERIKVVDFGIAKFDRADSEISKTTVGRFLGTALYASPEQCQMGGEVGPKSDVYSLAVMLYEMLTGKPPFIAEQPGMVLGMHLFMQPHPLWASAHDVPPSLHQLVHQMLAKNADERPAMEEVQSRLAAVKMEGSRLLWRLQRNGRALAAAAGVFVLAGFASVFFVLRGRLLRPVPLSPSAIMAAAPIPVSTTSISAAAASAPAVPTAAPTPAAAAPASAPIVSTEVVSPSSDASRNSGGPESDAASQSEASLDGARSRKRKLRVRVATQRRTSPSPMASVHAQGPDMKPPATTGPPPREPPAQPAATPPAPPSDKPAKVDHEEKTAPKPPKVDDGILR